MRVAVAYALLRIGAALEPGALDATVEAASTIWNPGTTAWDYIQPILTASGFVLRCDEQRRFTLTRPQATEAPGMLVLTNSLTGAEDSISREDESWFDGVLVIYKWRDLAGLEQVAYDVAGTDATNPLLIERSTPFPGAGAAAAVLASMTGRGRTIRSTALSDYAATPGMATRIDLDGLPVQVGVVSAVEWSLPENEMTVKSRDLVDVPVTSWRFMTEGRSWSSIPTGRNWSLITN